MSALEEVKEFYRAVESSDPFAGFQFDTQGQVIKQARYQFFYPKNGTQTLNIQFQTLIISTKSKPFGSMQTRSLVENGQNISFAFDYISPFEIYTAGWLQAPWLTTNWPAESSQRRKYSFQYHGYIDSNFAGKNGKVSYEFTLKAAPSRQKLGFSYAALPQLPLTLGSQYAYYNDENLTYENTPFNFQFHQLEKSSLRFQWRLSVYNTTNLRILWEIASDGKVWNSLLASTEAEGDFHVINLKSDIVERIWKSKSCEFEWFQVDCGEGITRSFDTIALLNHNLTAGARVKVYGQGDSWDYSAKNWENVPVYCEIDMPEGGFEKNLIWIAPAFENLKKFRHWRITIQDEFNSDDFISVGRFVAGQALVFHGTNNQESLSFGKVNFKDEVRLNGFSSIANNRALKKWLNLKFGPMDVIEGENYKDLQRYFDYSRDTLKALVIPEPTQPYRFSVFAKLKDLPSFSIQSIDAETAYAQFDLQWDEAR